MNQPEGNSTLVQNGIQTEMASLRAHVCPKVRQIYCFRTDRALQIVEKYPEKIVRTGEIVTAKGHVIPWHEIPGIRALELPTKHWVDAAFSPGDDESTKGEKAICIVVELLKSKNFPHQIIIDRTGVSEDIKGKDLRISTKPLDMQVKCDYEGGERLLGGTGNLFIQTMECNPWGKH